MNAMHYGMLGGDISFGPNLASLHMPSGENFHALLCYLLIRNGLETQEKGKSIEIA